MTPSDGSARSVDPELLLQDQRWLVVLARSLVGDADAEDVVQEARLLAWLHAPSDPARAGGWLRRITRNVALHVRRGSARRAAREPAGATPESLPPTDELVARVQMQRAVADAVLALAEPYRSVVLLRFFDRLPPRDIATRLDLPVETVRTRLKRALEQLRARLDRDYGARDAWAALLVPWTTVATATTKVGVKVAVAAVLIGTAGVATWERVKPSRLRASEGGAQVAAAGAVGPKEATKTDASDRGTDAATADGAARSAESVARTSRPLVGYEHVHLTARIVDETTHAPIAGAKFTASYWLGPGRAEASAMSDADGRVVVDFGPAESDNFECVVTHSDHARVEKDQALDDALSRADGERRAEHDFGEIALERGSIVSGRVVRMPDRSPVPEAQLRVFRRGSEASFWLMESEPAGSVRADGSFEFPERFASGFESPIVYAVTPTGVGWITPTIVKGRDRTEGLELAIEAPARVDIQVVDEAGAPLADAVVLAVPRFAPLGPSSYVPLQWNTLALEDGEWQRLFQATTDRDGRASLPYLPEGRDDDSLRRGSGDRRSYTLFARTAIGRRRTAVASVRIERGTRKDVRLVARRLVPLAIRGRIADDGGQPVADARVELAGQAEGTTDEAGLYALPPFTADRDRLAFKIAADGFGDLEQELLDSELGARIVPIRGEGGAVDREELVVDFVLSSRLTVKGRCIDRAGNGVAGVRVGIYQSESSSHSAVRREGFTDGDGHFLVDGVTPGIASLAITPPRGFRSVASRFVQAGVRDVEIRLVRESPARARLVVEVVDAASQQPAEVASAFVYPMDYGGSSPVCACAVGSVTAESLHVGRWWLGIDAANGARAHREIEIADPDEEVRVRLEVAACASIEGHVTRSDGQPWSKGRPMTIFLRTGSNFSDDGGYSVDADGRRSPDTYGPCARVDSDGIFRMAGVTPGIPMRLYSLEPTAIAETVVVLEPGEKRHVEMVTTPGVEVSFRFAGPMTAGRFRLEVSRDDGRLGLVTEEDAVRDGEVWHKAYFAPGHLRWHVTHSSEEDDLPLPRTVEGELEVVAGQLQTVEIRGLK